MHNACIQYYRVNVSMLDTKYYINNEINLSVCL